MKLNRTSSFPADIRRPLAMVLGSIGITLITLSLCIGAFSRNADRAGWILLVITFIQLVLLSINATLAYHIYKRNHSNAGT